MKARRDVPRYLRWPVMFWRYHCNGFSWRESFNMAVYQRSTFTGPRWGR